MMVLSNPETVRAANFQLQGAPNSTTAHDTTSQWYTAQTRSRHEKRVAEQLTCRGVTSYVPLYEKTSRWKDRRIRLHLPLFAGYVFVRFAWRDRLRALEIPGIVRLVSFGGNPVAVPDQEIESIRLSLESGSNVKPNRFLTAGQRVRIRSGPLEGCQGYLARRKGLWRLILSVNLIQRSVSVEVNAEDVSPSMNTRPGLANELIRCCDNAIKETR